ncbi:MAG: c-type cytochrome [Methyloligellaceae bacterium]
MRIKYCGAYYLSIFREVVLTFSIFLILSFSLSASAISDDQVKAGRALAEKLCKSCHAIGIKGESAMKAAPPFRTFSQNWPLEALEEALAEGIVTGHPDMPEFKLPPPDVGALITYLHTLQ